MKLSNGQEVVKVEGEEAVEFSNMFGGYHPGLVRVGPQRCLLPVSYTQWAQQYIDFEFRSTDIVIVTYPKCGTTWSQEILWTMLHNPNLDNPKGKGDLAVRSPFLEFDPIAMVMTAKFGNNPEIVETLKQLNPSASPDDGLFLHLAKNIPNPRVIKTHLPFSLLPPKMLDTCKVVYVMRNPKDLVCSYMHHHRLIKVHDYKGDNAQFVDYFCKGDLMYGCYAAHLEEMKQLEGHRNLHVTSYEQLKLNNADALDKLNKFVGLGLTEQQLANVAQQTGFTGMKARSGETQEDAKGNNTVAHGIDGLYDSEVIKKGGFFRKGEAGGWKKDLDESLTSKIDAWTDEKITKPLGIQFSYGK